MSTADAIEPGSLSPVYSDYSEDIWIEWFLGTKGNEYFCDVDAEFISDRFNLTGLVGEVENVQDVVDIITDQYEAAGGTSAEDAQRKRLEAPAQHFYGLVHARYILTARGLQKMLEKFKNADFGRCPRVHCLSQQMLPIGLHDSPRHATVKLYCPCCEDVYTPKSSRHAQVDGAYFGTSFPGMFFQVYPSLVPKRPRDRYVPKIFGFKIHAMARLARWQDHLRIEAEKKLEGLQGV